MFPREHFLQVLHHGTFGTARFLKISVIWGEEVSAKGCIVINWKHKNKHYVLVFVNVACVCFLWVSVLVWDCLRWLSSAFPEPPLELWSKGIVSQHQIGFWDYAGVLSPTPGTRNRVVLCLPLEWGAVLVPFPLFHSEWHWVALEGLQRVMGSWDVSALSSQCGLAAPKASSLILGCVLQPEPCVQ